MAARRRAQPVVFVVVDEVMPFDVHDLDPFAAAVVLALPAVVPMLSAVVMVTIVVVIVVVVIVVTMAMVMMVVGEGGRRCQARQREGRGQQKAFHAFPEIRACGRAARGAARPAARQWCSRMSAMMPVATATRMNLPSSVRIQRWPDGGWRR